MENGLPQNTVQALAQTKDGFLWLGTEAGLVRFDGVEFQTYDRNSTSGLPGPALPGRRYSLSACNCGRGVVDWDECWTGAVEGRNGKDDSRRRMGCRGTVFGAGLRLGNRGIVIASDRKWGGLDHGRTDSLPVRAGYSASLTGAASKMAVKAVDLPGEWCSAQATATTVAVAAARRGILPIELWARSFPAAGFRRLFADREGALWIGTNAGLVRWVKGKVERFPETDPLATASILALMEDREGDLWVGTETGGLDVLRDQRFRMIDTRDGLTSDRITTVVEDGGRHLVGRDAGRRTEYAEPRRRDG